MYNILLVDDEPLVKISLQNTILTYSDFSVIGSVANGAEALEFMTAHPVDAVITDLQMPIIDGVTLVQKLRKNGFNGPILALSNYSDFELVRDAMKAGTFDYLLKADLSPKLIAECLDKIRSLLREREIHEKQQESKRSQHAAHLSDLFRFAFLQFLATPNALPKNDIILHGLPDGLMPAVLIDITMDATKLGQIITSQFIESVSIETFSDITPTFTAQITDNEVIMMISETSIAQHKLILSVRLERLYRTIRAYTSHEPHILYMHRIDSIDAIHSSYHLCQQVKSNLLNQKPIVCLSFNETAKSAIEGSDFKAEILQTLLYVNQNYMNKITLDDISAYVHLNKEYLCRLFKKETGKNLFQYICDVRMQVAANLLTTTSMPINTISNLTGFSSPYVFSKKFKEYYKLSPADYASHIAKNEVD